MNGNQFLPLDAFKQIYHDLECSEVRYLHEKLKVPSSDTPKVPEDHHEMVDRAKLFNEEVDRFALAAVEGDMTKMAHALVDLVYAAKGTAIMLGLPWGELWKKIHQCNVRNLSAQSVDIRNILIENGFEIGDL